LSKPFLIKVPYIDNPAFNRPLQTRKDGVDFNTDILSREENLQFLQHMFDYSDLRHIPAESKSFLFGTPGFARSQSLMKNTILTVGNYAPAPYSQEQNAIIKRFGNAFEQAYVRFLDLQKAEAQAREAQIEAALERVRSRSMAMHKSEEVMDVAVAVYDELLKLDFTYGATTIIIMDKQTGFMEHWLAGFLKKNHVESYPVRNIEHPLHAAQLDAWRKGSKYISIELSGDELTAYTIEMFVDSGYKNLPEEEKIMLKTNERAVFNLAFMSHGALMWAPSPLSDEKALILQRFAKVFDQTYTRFLDLQKAEAQAREAQIEAALERVRSRTLTMQKSEELEDAANILFKQVQSLGIPVWSCGYNIWEQGEKFCTGWMSSEGMIQRPFRIPLTESPTFIRFLESKEKGETFYVEEVSGKALAEHYDYMLSLPEFAATVEGYINAGYPLPSFQINHVTNFKNGNLIFITSVPVANSHDIFKRFANVFEQTYTRFLDLQKAEAQAREAQIEAALEKVRSASLAIHQSQELEKVVVVLFEKLKDLGVPFDSAFIYLFDKPKRKIVAWVASKLLPNPVKVNMPFDEDIANNPIITDLWYSIESSEHGLNKSYKEKDKDDYFRYEAKYNQLIPESITDFQVQAESWITSFATEKNSIVGFDSWHGQLTTNEDFEIIKRFAKVFEQAYIRFLDLQKAEAQAREAQIEAALERVRSKTMAMHRSEQLPETAQVLFEQFAELGKIPDRISIGIIKEESQLIEWWATDQMGSRLALHFDASIHGPTIGQYFTAWKEGKESIMVDLSGEALQEWVAYVRDVVKMPIDDSKMKGRRVHHGAFFSKGLLLISAHDPMPTETLQLLVRFAKVFSQTYTRFLDLQKAEAQAREAQIEAALERVRSRSMAMHKSEEFPEVIQVVFEQFLLLDFKIDSAQFDVSFRESDDLNLWTAAPGQPYPTKLHIPYADYEVFNSIKKAKKAGHAFVSIQLTKEEKNDFFNYFFLHAPNIPEERKKFLLSSPGVVRSAVLLEKVSLAIQNYSGIPYSDAEHNILKRFAKAFEQTYVRFLDLQKAEAQAREATIEAALEKVRGKAMAMHNSDDLIATAGVLFAEMRKLGINTFRCGVGLLTKESRKAKLYSATTTNETDNLPMVGSALLDGHEVLTEMYDRWLRNEDYFPLMKGELLKAYYEKINSTFTVPTEQTEQYEQHGYFLPFSEGLFYGWAEKPYTEDEIKTLHRFKAIVDLTFRRYIELQNSEEIAREAVRSASLDRVRAEIASMRTKQDLERITPLIWKELTTLGIPFVRCGVFIMDEQEELIHTFLSTPDGKAIAAFHVPYGSTPLAGSIEFWREKKMYLTHWGLKEYAEFADAFIDTNEVEKRAHYLSSVPKDGIHLHLLPFMQGMLYVGNTNPLTEDNLHLVQSVADAFSTAYARYEDFNKIESAKAQAERTLVDLKQAQQQLVQSEKMASLGELTAGIAHEIQNPLNFVNNFSEVSTELVKEMAEEVEKGNLEEVKALAKDVVQNLEKINHHGKRAADIVKGMLQHSRSSSGVKEPTDINALADEYLRLAYHGLRAKDKSFNAKFETHLDPTLPNVNVIPQDIGRVILNLITNAFYAVNERQKLLATSHELLAKYEPTVSVRTRKEGNKVLISVKDNGSGIPDKIKEKIFQPFFTTKPTGQGTGLGLSLSYDIVKSHGGELKVQTLPAEAAAQAGKEGEGSQFVIQLPIV
jgi:signal transduction histidine kinase